MPTVSPEFAWQVAVTLAAVVATYGGIRADLKAMHSRMGRVEADIDHARERMDNHIERSHA